MQEENIIKSVRQHSVILLFRTIRWLVLGAIAGIVLGLMNLFVWAMVSSFAIITLGILREYRRWDRSRLEITTQKVILRIQSGIFSGYELGLHYHQIKDIAYSKNHFLHSMTDSGNLFLRSSAGKEGEIVADCVPDVAEIYGLVNELLTMKPDDRKQFRMKQNLMYAQNPGQEIMLDFNAIIEDQRKRLLAIPGITDAFILTSEDRKFIFENEEDRNHGVYEAIRRKGVICVGHDSTFRNPDDTIVFKKGSKVIFPAVRFHEVSRPNAVSGSPGKIIHEYLFKRLRNPDELDATILVGFD